MVKDQSPDFLGRWRHYKIESQKDYALFFLWLGDEKRVSGIENKGFMLEHFKEPSGRSILAKADILNFCKDGDSIIFTKRYSRELVGGKDIVYNGIRKEYGYRGVWTNRVREGPFLLVPWPKKVIESPIGEELLDCEVELLTKKISDKRQEFPFLSLDKIVG